MNLKKVDIGVWVKAIDELPEHGSFIPIKINGKYDVSTFRFNIFTFDFSNDVYKKEDYNIIEWLKPISQVYVLTEDELKELADKSFDAGYSLCCLHETNHPSNAMNKEQFIQSLTK